MKNNKKKTATTVTCGNAPWNRYFFTRIAKECGFRQDGVLPSVKTADSEKTSS